jgi:hypothetical protein
MALAQAILFSKAIAKNFEPSVCYSIAMYISQKWFVIIHNFCKNIAGTRAVNTIDLRLANTE